MRLEHEFRYPFAVPNPQLKVARRSVVQGLVIGTCIFISFWLAGLIPLVTFVVFQVFFVGGSIVGFRIVSLQFTRAVVILTPTGLVVERWKEREATRWGDVASVALATYEPSNWISGLYVRFVYGQDGTIPFAKITRRHLRFGRRGFPTKVVALYLQDPGGFVEEAQRYLTSTPAPSA
jgi:hypothetical protein